MEKINWETVKLYTELPAKDGGNLYRQLFSAFFEEIHSEIAALFDLITKNNFVGAAALAHKLKSSSGNLGLVSVYEYLNDIEDMIVNQDCKDDRILLLNVSYIKADLDYVFPILRDSC
ncbi:MAG: Hpt domain-containing protein [Bdellovibrionales bacterium]